MKGFLKSEVSSIVFKAFVLAIAFISLLLIVISLATFIPMYINDMALSEYQAQVVQDLVLPEGTTVEEYISACCNSSGTGNHTDLYVAVLIKSTADYETLSEKVKNSFAEEDTYCNIHVVEKNGSETLAMKTADISFSKKIEQPTGYYILEFNKRAPLSLFDLRGC